jgi:hypothetical protein
VADREEDAPIYTSRYANRYTSGDTSSYAGRYRVTDKTRETRLRRKAERQGLRLVKSRRRDPRALHYGTYALVRGATSGANWREGVLVVGDPNTGYGLDLDDVERWLTSDYYIDIGTPDPIGPAPLTDLAYPLAQALTAADRQGGRRPPYEIRAEEDGKERGPTEVEQAAFTAALERALGDLERSGRLAEAGMTSDRRNETA